jgi:hypothetical protein
MSSGIIAAKAPVSTDRATADLMASMSSSGVTHPC